MDFQPIRDILLNELHIVGGRLFAEECRRQALQHRAQEGHDKAEQILKLEEFTKKLLGTDTKKSSPDQELFDSLLAVMAVLNGQCDLDELEELGIYVPTKSDEIVS
jgi:hypothetical protein